MNLAVGALIVLLALLAVGLAATAAPPAPVSVSASASASALSQGCASDAGCPAPQTCDAGTRTCRDATLPAKLAAAQSDAAALLAATQKLAALLGPGGGTYWGQVRDFAVGATGGLVTVPPGSLSAASSAISSASAALASYLNNTLAAPGCSAGGAASCGYCAAVAALTPASPKSQFIALGLSVPALVVQLGGVTQAVGAAVAAASNVIDSLKTQITTLGSANSVGALLALAGAGAVSIASGQSITSTASQLQTLATSATQSGQELYAHFTV